MVVARRIVVVLPGLQGGGAERVTVNLVNGLVDDPGFDWHLVVFEGGGPLAGALSPRVTVHEIGTARLRHALPGLVRVLRRLKPDLVYSTLGYVNLGLLMVRRVALRGVPVLVREANTPSVSIPTLPAPWLFRFLYRWLYPGAAGVICQSRLMRDEMGAMFGIPIQRLHLIHNPVDERGLRAGLRARRDEGDGRRFVAVGRLTRQKGFDRLVEMLVDMPPDTRVTVFGTGSMADALIEQAAALGVGSLIRFAGFDPSPWDWIAGADALLLPSRWEGMPNAALESLACGTPVIATPEAGGVADIVDAAKPGAVTVCEAGAPYVAAMRAVEPRNVGNPAPSMLPDMFRADVALDRFRALLGSLT